MCSLYTARQFGLGSEGFEPYGWLGSFRTIPKITQYQISFVEINIFLILIVIVTHYDARCLCMNQI